MNFRNNMDSAYGIGQRRGPPGGGGGGNPSGLAFYSANVKNTSNNNNNMNMYGSRGRAPTSSAFNGNQQQQPPAYMNMNMNRNRSPPPAIGMPNYGRDDEGFRNRERDFGDSYRNPNLNQQQQQPQRFVSDGFVANNQRRQLDEGDDMFMAKRRHMDLDAHFGRQPSPPRPYVNRNPDNTNFNMDYRNQEDNYGRSNLRPEPIQRDQDRGFFNDERPIINPDRGFYNDQRFNQDRNPRDQVGGPYQNNSRGNFNYREDDRNFLRNSGNFGGPDRDNFAGNGNYPNDNNREFFGNNSGRNWNNQSMPGNNSMQRSTTSFQSSGYQSSDWNTSQKNFNAKRNVNPNVNPNPLKRTFNNNAGPPNNKPMNNPAVVRNNIPPKKIMGNANAGPPPVKPNNVRPMGPGNGTRVMPNRPPNMAQNVRPKPPMMQRPVPIGIKPPPTVQAVAGPKPNAVPLTKAEKQRRKIARKRGFIMGGVKLAYIYNKNDKLPQPESQSFAITFFGETPIYSINVDDEDAEVAAAVILDDDFNSDDEDDAAAVGKAAGDGNPQPSRKMAKRARKQLRTEWTTLHDAKDYKCWNNWWKDFKHCGSEIDKQLEVFGALNLEHCFLPNLPHYTTEQVVANILRSGKFALSETPGMPYNTMKQIFTLMNKTFLENLQEPDVENLQDFIRNCPNSLWVFKMRSMVYMWAKYKEILEMPVVPTTKPEAKPEVKTEAKPEVKPEVKAEAKAEVKTEVKAENKAENAAAETEYKLEGNPNVKWMAKQAFKNPCFHYLAKQAFCELQAISEVDWPDHEKLYPGL